MRSAILFLRFEGTIVLALSIVLYAHAGAGWLLFAVLFFTPDLTMLGYLHRTSTGTICYNIGHSYAVSLPVAGLGYLLPAPTLLAIGLIWTAHIGFDRMLGYGLKSNEGFHETHLGRIGRSQRNRHVGEQHETGVRPT